MKAGKKIETGVKSMRFRTAGKIADNLWYLGREEAGVYVLEGRDSSVLINGGLSYILPDVLKQMKDFGINIEKIGKILILHSHFDHVGVIPYFKRIYPQIEIYASEPAWKLFNMQKYVDVMNTFSRLSAKQAGAEEGIKGLDLDWRDDITGRIISGGDKIDLGGAVLDIIYTPGHTHCSITAYEPNLKAMFASDGGGIPYLDTSFPSMNTNMAQFLESLETLKPYPVQYLCADHYGYITGDEAGRFIDLTLSEGRKWKAYMEDVYRKFNGDIDAASKATNEFFYKEMPGYFIAPDILEGVFKGMFKYISKNM